MCVGCVFVCMEGTELSEDVLYQPKRDDGGVVDELVRHRHASVVGRAGCSVASMNVLGKPRGRVHRPVCKSVSLLLQARATLRHDMSNWSARTVVSVASKSNIPATDFEKTPGWW